MNFGPNFTNLTSTGKILARSLFRSSTQRKLSIETTNPRPINKQRFRFDGRTAIVTGGARGIGKEYCKLLAARGANVIVNDFGGSLAGDKKNSGQQSVAQEVAQEIGEKFATRENRVIPHSGSVGSEEDVKSLIDCALGEFKRIDILINNAGILRDKSFAKMSIQDWDQVQQVHLRGSFLVTRACWPIMRKQSFGRIIMTSSTSGVYGNFGQANYSAAKLGLVGLSHTLAKEGTKDQIHCNSIIPLAASRMTSDILSEDLAHQLQPKFIAPIVVWLCHESCEENGSIIEAAGRWFGRHKMIRSQGVYVADLDGPEVDSLSLEKLNERISEIGSFPDSTQDQVDSFESHLSSLMSVLSNKT